MRWFSSSENVTRVLSDLKPNPEFWCKFGVHKWTRWESFKFVEVKTYNSYHAERIYESECACCNKRRFKKVTTPKLRLE